MPVGQPPTVKYHVAYGPLGRGYTFCVYAIRGQSERVPLPNQRVTCPRCRAGLRRRDQVQDRARRQRRVS